MSSETSSNASPSINEETAEEQNDINLRTDVKIKKKSRLSVKSNKKKESKKKKYNSLSARFSSSSKVDENAFPGIPLHVIQTDQEKSRNLKNLQKNIDEARTELEKLYAAEQAAKQRLQALEKREEQLLRSCEKLEEISAVGVQQSSSSKRKASTTQTVSVTLNDYTMEVDLRDVQVCELLGTGASGATVYLVNVGGWCCAMKELPRNISNEMDSECFEKEMALLYQIPNHPNIARYLFHKKLRGRYCLFMSRYSGTLRGEIDKRKETKDYFPIRTIIKLSYEIANGLHFLHNSENIIHRDLKVKF